MHSHVSELSDGRLGKPLSTTDSGLLGTTKKGRHLFAIEVLCINKGAV